MQPFFIFHYIIVSYITEPHNRAAGGFSPPAPQHAASGSPPKGGKPSKGGQARRAVHLNCRTVVG